MSWDSGLPTAAELEERFTAFVVSFGGERVADLLPEEHQRPLNADYLLWDRTAIAELKTLTVDRFADQGIGRRVSALTDQWVRNGVIPSLRPGRNKVNTEGLPFKEQRKAFKIFTRPMRKDADRASLQSDLEDLEGQLSIKERPNAVRQHRAGLPMKQPAYTGGTNGRQILRWATCHLENRRHEYTATVVRRANAGNSC